MTNKTRIIGTFDNQANTVLSILCRYWGILTLDPKIEVPSITYRRGRSIGDRLVHSHYTRPISDTTWLGTHSSKLIGMYSCGSCSICSYTLKTKNFISAATNKTFEIREFLNCKSEGVVYLCKCTCPYDYIGKTKRELRRRICEHIGEIRHRRDTPIARHVWENHGGDPKCLSFCAIERTRQSPRRGEWDKYILQKETQWIHRMRSVSPKGLNEQLTYGYFI